VHPDIDWKKIIDYWPKYLKKKKEEEEKMKKRELEEKKSGIMKS
jgi:hypothetical protein